MSLDMLLSALARSISSAILHSEVYADPLHRYLPMIFYRDDVVMDRCEYDRMPVFYRDDTVCELKKGSK
jgi:hypothetical protein